MKKGRKDEIMKEEKLTQLDKEYLLKCGYREDELNQIEEALNFTIYELNGKRKISVKTARRILGDEMFLSGLSRSAFHWTAIREKNGQEVYFDSSPLFETC